MGGQDISAGGSEGEREGGSGSNRPGMTSWSAAYQTLSVATCGGIDLGLMSPTIAPLPLKRR